MYHCNLKLISHHTARNKLIRQQDGTQCLGVFGSSRWLGGTQHHNPITVGTHQTPTMADEEQPNRDVITLHCVAQGSKLRIRFHSYTNADGKTYTNVYNNTYNCQFPRAIRREGRYYQVGRDDLQLVAGGAKTPFYRIRKDNIIVLPHGPDGRRLEEASPAQVEEVARGTKKSTSKKVSPVSVRDVVEERPAQVFEVNECVICMSETPDTIFIPCAHLCTCAGCFGEMKKHTRPSCPLCRRTVLQSIPN